MKILFDNGVPNTLAVCLRGHQITCARKVGWHELGNGDLIQRAELTGYEAFLSTDKNFRYQQKVTRGKISVVILDNSRWPVLRLYLDRIAAAMNACTPGSYAEVKIPFKYLKR